MPEIELKFHFSHFIVKFSSIIFICGKRDKSLSEYGMTVA